MAAASCHLPRDVSLVIMHILTQSPSDFVNKFDNYYKQRVNMNLIDISENEAELIKNDKIVFDDNGRYRTFRQHLTTFDEDILFINAYDDCMRDLGMYCVFK
jgi:hypothetical protein